MVLLFIFPVDTLPRQQGLEPREELKRFHEQYYSANLMTLVVLGKESISSLEAWVRESFGHIPNRFTPEPASIYWGKISPLIAQNEPKVLEIEPMKSDRRLQMMWPILIPSPLSRTFLQMVRRYYTIRYYAAAYNSL